MTSEALAHVSAFGSPLVALIAGVFGVTFSWRSWQTARNKLKLDLFEKRYRVYLAIKSHVDRAIRDSAISADDVLQYLSIVEEARWLFSDEMFDYLGKDLGAAISTVSRITDEMSDLAGRGPEWRRLASERRNSKHQLFKQQELLRVKMDPYLRLYH
ncbi:hypothetical protein [Variovorax sp. CY25R-8]|uniref:hypothetical protein n=1 Tax=Variovorax sp. CY25R-8 TaxID=2855501 RepID=UPI0021BB6AF7|nr:hypothetical protein [Variovorax sp. CY25R-8]MCT8178901.1 hypothetical protein [Variovorax sp. CY25R-8]